MGARGRRLELGRAALPVLRRPDGGRGGAVPRLPRRVPARGAAGLPRPLARLGDGRRARLRAGAERRCARVRALVRGADDGALRGDARPDRAVASSAARDGRAFRPRAHARRRHTAPARRARADAVRRGPGRAHGGLARGVPRGSGADRGGRARARRDREALSAPAPAAARPLRPAPGGSSGGGRGGRDRGRDDRARRRPVPRARARRGVVLDPGAAHARAPGREPPRERRARARARRGRARSRRTRHRRRRGRNGRRTERRRDRDAGQRRRHALRFGGGRRRRRDLGGRLEERGRARAARPGLRRRRRGPGRAGRVLSPQFVLWLLPLVPLVVGRRGRLASALLAVVLVLTQLWFPELYRDYVNERGAPETAYLLVRNGVLLALLVSLAAPSLRSLRSPSSPTAANSTNAGAIGTA